MEEPESPLQILTPCGGGRQCSNPNSPEFEFRMIQNPSFPQPNLLSADELFSDGFLLPLHKINLSNEPPPPRQDIIEASGPGEESSNVESAELSASPRLTSSKRWMDIFKKSSRSSTTAGADGNSKEKEGIDDYSKKKRREKNNAVSASNGFSASELNINIWPFSRSRSAGNDGTRPRSAAAARKVSSAPCSRSNSAGESKSRKRPSSPNRAAGVHLGRSSPVWQVRRGGSGGGVAVSARSSDAFLKSAQKGIRKYGNDSRRKTPAAGSVCGGPVCIGYRHHLSCRSDDNSAHGGGCVISGEGGQFKGQSHFFGYEGRCGLPSNFDSTYCYALGYAAGVLLQSGKTGLISSVGNLAAPVSEWTVGGTPLTSLMDVERRHGKFKPVIKKAMVELEGAPFKKFVSMREEWALKNRYLNPGPIQFVGPVSEAVNHTLLLELEA